MEQPTSWTQNLRQHSGRLARATSASFIGGDVLPVLEAETVGATPLQRQASRREEQRSSVEQQLNVEAQRFVQRNMLCILITGFTLFSLSFVQLYLLVWAISAAILHGGKECDAPLKYYILFMWSFNNLWNYVVVPYATRVWMRNFNLGDVASFWFRIVLGLPCWCPIALGAVSLCRSKTCAKTNPDLYYPTMYFIAGQVVFMAILQAGAIFAFFGLRRIMLWVSTLSSEPGCQKAVRKLPKVPRGSVELLDDEDGKVMECSICTDSLDGVEMAVRTPCAHYFHEECLATWCKTHISCPICRGPIGEADEPEEGDGSSVVEP